MPYQVATAASYAAQGEDCTWYIMLCIVILFIIFFVKRLHAFDNEFDNLINFDLSNEYYLLIFD